MKVLSLNLWHGNCKEVLADFLSASLCDDIDIFCFQEANGPLIEPVLGDLFDEKEFSLVLADKNIQENRHYVLRTYIRKSYSLLSSCTLLSRDDAETGQALATEVSLNGQSLTIINIHGMPHPGDKLDTAKRLEQTDTLIEHAEHLDHPSIICGDFNLLTQTESVIRFSQAGFRDLIKDYQVKTTRNRLAWDRFPDSPQLFADYVFSSSSIQINDFKVISNEASDHLPMLVDLTLL